MHPLVLIKSFGKAKCGDIIHELLRLNSESIMEPMAICIDSCNLKAYKLCICTKYYKTDVLLFECENIISIPNAVKDEIEGAIFYFDSNDSHFLSELEALVKFVKDNNIGVSTLITRNLNENSVDGISYDELKSRCKLDINVIDLNAKMDNDEPVGYAELLELLENHVWSSVHISSHNSNKIYNSVESDANVEDALNEFEELLNKFQQFKDVSRSMGREEVLENAENLAELFANILNED